MHRNKKLEESFEYNASWFKSLLPHPLRTRAWSFIWTTFNTHHTRVLCAKLYDIVLMVLEKKIFNCLKLFLPLSPFGRGRYPLFEQTWIPIISKSALCQIWLKLAQWFWRKLSFSLCCYYIPFKSAWSFIWMNLNPYLSSMFCTKFEKVCDDDNDFEHWTN